MDHNGFQISCFGAKDGVVSATATGGTPPYSYGWSTGANTQTVTELAVGYLNVKASDANGNTGVAEITLQGPDDFKLELTPFKYPSGLNISCYECYNGSIDLVVFGGVAPYTYAWNDDITTQDRSGLGAMSYDVYVEDANGCYEKGGVGLAQPEKATWGMGGNANTDPASHFVGTSDNTDLVFRTQNQERLRVKANGELKVSSLALPDNYGLLVTNEAGAMKRLTDGDWLTYIEGRPGCPAGASYPWLLCGNHIAPGQLLGSTNQTALKFITHNSVRMTIDALGKVGIGTSAPDQQLEVAHQSERGGMILNNSSSGSNAHSEIRFTEGNTERWGLGCDFDANGGQDFFLWDSYGSIKRWVVNYQGKMGIGMDPPATSGSIYRLYVDGGVACRDVLVTINNFPDYVFQRDYELLSLEAYQNYIQENGHLPHIPSAAEVDANKGVELGDLQTKMLRTVEEQALYILQLKKEVDQLRREMDELKRVK